MCFTVLSLLVFSATSTSMISKPFQFPLLTTSPPLEVLKVESPPLKACSPPTFASVKSFTSELQLGHKKFHHVDCQPLYTMPPKHHHLIIHAPSRTSQSFSKILPRASRATRVALIQSLPSLLTSSFFDLHRQQRIDLIEHVTRR